MSSTDIPEDVIKDILEYEKEFLQQPKRRRKLPYPSSRDIAEAVKIVALTFLGNPDEFPDTVLQYLKKNNYYIRHVTTKRIWRTYENLVRNGIIGDRLGVVKKEEKEPKEDTNRYLSID